MYHCMVQRCYLSLLLLLAKSSFTVGITIIHVTPSSQNGNCVVESCITLSQFAAHSITSQESNITLIFLPGNHSLVSSISFANLEEFHIKTMEGYQTEIVCAESAHLSLNHINQVNISRVKFVGCQGSRLESIDHILLENVMFTSVLTNGAALELVEVGSAHISRSLFVSNSFGSHRSQTEILEYLKNEYTAYSNIETSAKVGGALTVSQSNVSISDCLFEGNNAEVGGAIYSEHNSNLTVRNCNFTQNYVHCIDTLCLGGVMVINSGCTLNVHESSFWNNTDAGVIVLLSATAHVSESEFSNNKGKSGGVFALFESTLVFERTTFSKNVAIRFGGVIFAGKAGKINITEAIFDRNEATYGGVIFGNKHSQAIFEKSTFTNNEAEIHGGVTYMLESTVNIHNSTFNNNSASYGAALNKRNCNITVHNSTFFNNTAHTNGGALYIPQDTAGLRSNVLVRNCYFLYNRAEAVGGALMVYNSDIIILNNTFSFNSAGTNGGVIYGRNGTTIFIEKSTFTQNFAQIGIFNTFQCIVTVNESTFEGNNASSAGGNAAISASTIKLFSSKFMHNFARQGSILYTINSSALIDNCTCSHNKAMSHGGVVNANENSSIEIKNSLLTSNSASIQGGVGSINRSAVSMENCTIKNNIATHFGGTLINDQAISIIVKNCTFINNSAQMGGALYNFESVMTIYNSLFRNNSAAQAAALLVVGNGNVSINGSAFSDNIADEIGGVSAVYNSTLTVHNNTFSGNSAKLGGAITVERGTLVVDGSDFLDNLADHGGAVYVTMSTVSLSYCTIKNNSAVKEGGGVYALRNASINFARSIFMSNHANSAGGVLFAVLHVTVNVDNCTFFNNSAEHGGVTQIFQGKFSIHRCMFLNNFALFDGAVLYSFGDLEGNFTSSTFLSNRAGEYGGAIGLRTVSKVNIESSIFEKNSASIAGGVVYCKYKTELFVNNSNFTSNTVGLDRLYALRNDTANDENSTDSAGGIIFVSLGSVEVQNSNFLKNRANLGGVLFAEDRSAILLKNCTCSYNGALEKGGVIHSEQESTIIAEGTIFKNNQADGEGGVLSAGQGVTISIRDCNLMNNTAGYGGVLYSLSNNVTIHRSSFHDNIAQSGVLNLFQSSLSIFESSFVHNTVIHTGGTLVIERGTLFASKSVFSDNLAAQGGVLYVVSTLVSLNFCSFRNNKAEINGGVIYVFFQSNLVTSHSNFSNNTAGNDGGVVFSLVQNKLKVNHGQFISNVAGSDGAVFFISFQTNLTLSTFSNTCSLPTFECESGIILEKNIAIRGGVIFTNDFSFIKLNGNISIEVRKNTAQLGIFYMYESTLNSSAVLLFEDNVEAVHIEKSNVIFNGVTHFLNCSSSADSGVSLNRKGGAVKSIRSVVTFDGQSLFQDNKAENGAAMHAIESSVTMNGEMVVTRNTADVNGGGMCFINSKLSLRGLSKFTRNHAQAGGAIYSQESTIEMLNKSEFTNNTARNGGGFYLQSSELNMYGNITTTGNRALESGGGIIAHKSTIVGESIVKNVENEAKRGGGWSIDGQTRIYQTIERLNSSSQPTFIFIRNTADFGGALFVQDENNSLTGTCANIPSYQNTSAYCFFITFTTHNNYASSVRNFQFSQNVAKLSGDDLFGGLLDRCTANTEVANRNLYEGLSVFRAVSRKSDLKTVGSHPVRVCFCSNGHPNCSYQHPPIEIKSGERFSLQLAALDQAKHIVNATIHVSLETIAGGLGERQLSQHTFETCTELNYSLFSPLEYEKLSFYPDGPCGNVGISRKTLEVNIVPCSCPIGFQISTRNTDECVCGCDSVLASYISECDHSTQSVVRKGNYWLTYINTSTSSGYLVYPNCPLDYCHLPTLSVKVNLNDPYGSDAQCTSNKAGLLCGACKDGLSLSLGNSRCIPCPNYWPGVMIMILLFGFLAGIGLVAAILILNLTVGVGTINGLIFYANIVEAFKTTFFPSSMISFASIIVSWLNLEPGFDVCLFQGMDKYTKTWIQLAFPTYVIFLVGVIIIITQHSTRFSKLVGKKNPVATLATLILLSYAKFLQIVITALSFANLEYPDGSRKSVWLPDATIEYFKGKHAALILVSILILITGVLFTTLLFSWQWLLRLPEKRYFKWITHQKLNLFIESYNAPYNLDHRFWSGLLLMVRVILYFVSAVNVSGDPRVTFLTLLFILGGLITGRWMLKGSIYKTWHNEVFEGITHINLLIFTAFSWYTFETGKNQSIVAHISVAVTLILFVVVIFHHIRTEMKISKILQKLKKHCLSDSGEKDDTFSSESEHTTTVNGHERLRRGSTFSVVEVPKQHRPSIDTIEETEGLADIEFHDVDNLGTCFVNPLFAIGAQLDEDALADSEQADCILDELGVRDEDD